MEHIQLPSLGHFRNGNGWLGSLGPLRYEIETPRERPTDPPAVDEEDKEYDATVVIWPGPFSRPYAQETGRMDFAITQDGFSALRAYLTQEAEKAATDPRYSPQETNAVYRAKKEAEKTPSAP